MRHKARRVYTSCYRQVDSLRPETDMEASDNDDIKPPHQGDTAVQAEDMDFDGDQLSKVPQKRRASSPSPTSNKQPSRDEASFGECGRLLNLIIGEARGHAPVSLSLLQEAVTQAVNMGFGEQMLMEAARCGCHIAAQLLINAGVDVNMQDENRMRPLHLAIQYDQCSVVKVLIDNGASEHSTIVCDHVPLHTAAFHGSIASLNCLNHLGMCMEARDKNHETALMLAIKQEQELFIARLCQRVFASGQLDLLYSILSCVTDSGRANCMFYNVCKLLILEDRIELMQYIQNSFSRIIQCMEIKSLNEIIHLVAEHGTQDMFQSIQDFMEHLDVPNGKGETPIFLAVQNPRIQSVAISKILEQIPIAKTYRGETLLHVSTKRGRLDMSSILISWRPSMCQQQDAYGYLPLHLAACGKNESLLDLLLKHTTITNISDGFGRTPCFYIINNPNIDRTQFLKKFMEGRDWTDTSICGTFRKENLLHVGANLGLDNVCHMIIELCPKSILQLDSNKKLPISYAIKIGLYSIVEEMFLILTSQDIDTQRSLYDFLREDCFMVTKSIIEDGIFGGYNIELLASIIPFMQNDTLLDTLLHAASSLGNTDIMRKLLGAGAYVDTVEGPLKETPLHAALRNGHVEAVKYLIEEEAQEDSPDVDGNLPIHIAAKCGLEEEIKLLTNSLKTIEIINAKNADKETPLLLSLQREFVEVGCVNQLLEHGADMTIKDGHGYLPLEMCAKTPDCSQLFVALLCHVTDKQQIVGAFEIYLDNESIIIEDLYSCYRQVAQKLIDNQIETSNLFNSMVKRQTESNDILHVNNCICVNNMILSQNMHLVNLYLQEYGSSDILNSPEKCTFSHIAAQYGSDELFQMMFMESSHINARTSTASQDTPLHLAIQNKQITDLTLSRAILDRRSKISKSTLCRRNMLTSAIVYKRNTLVECLLKHFSYLLNKWDSKCKSPVFHYAKWGTSTDVLREMLMKTDKNFKMVQAKKGPEKSCMQLCLENEPVRITAFLDVFFELDPDSGIYCCGSTITESILHTAVKMGLLDVCQHLITVDPRLSNIADREGRLPMHYAIKQGSNDLVNFLIQHTPDPNSVGKSQDGINKSLHNDTIVTLISRGFRCCHGVAPDTEDPDDKSPTQTLLSEYCLTSRKVSEYKINVQLHLAARNGDNTLLKRLASSDPGNINQVDNNHCSVLHIAISNKKIKLDTIRTLVNNGAMVNVLGGDSMKTPLHRAFHEKRHDICRYLLANGAEPCIAENAGVSPIHEALQRHDYEMFRAMLYATKNLNKCNKKGYSLLRVALEDRAVSYSFTELLVNMGADVNMHTLPFNRYSRHNGKCNIKAVSGLLHFSVMKEKWQECKLLCNRQPRQKACSFTPIHVLVSLNKLPPALDVIEHLLNTGIDINELDHKDKITAIDLAALQGSYEFTELLIAHGANVDSKPKTTLINTLQHNFWSPEVIVTLLQAGTNVSAPCMGKSCDECETEEQKCSSFVCSLLSQRSYNGYGGFKLVCELLIQLRVPLFDLRLAEVNECKTILGDDIHRGLLDLLHKPRPLSAVCRDVIRNHFQALRFERSSKSHLKLMLDALPLPALIKSFLKMEELDRDEIRKNLSVVIPDSPTRFATRYSAAGVRRLRNIWW